MNRLASLFFGLTLFISGFAHAQTPLVQTAVDNAETTTTTSKGVPKKDEPQAKGSKRKTEKTGEAQTSFLPQSRAGFGQTEDAKKFVDLCEGVRLEKGHEFDFSKMELRLLCGDKKGDVIGQPWSDIPPNQAAYFLKAFLQSRAYHQPEFIQDGNVLFVRSGNISRLRRFRITGGPDDWDPPKRRLIEGLPLTPSLLDEMQGWALSQIKDEGYACAAADSQADPSTGEALVELDTGEPKRILSLKEAGDRGIARRALDRYNAFRVGDLYREYLITLTRRRTTESGILQTFSLTNKCLPGGVDITRDLTLGPSRTFSVGVGANTDQGALIKGSIRRTRIGPSASSAEAQALLSYLRDNVNTQSLSLNYKWYYSDGEARSYVEPSVSFLHEANVVHNLQSLTPKIVHGWNKEFSEGQLDVRLGPAYLNSHLYRGKGPRDVDLFYGSLETRWMSHKYEYYLSSPREGGTIDAQVLVTDPSWGAKFRAQKLQVHGEKLWNIFKYDPPLLVLGLRFNVSTVIAGNEIEPTDLPDPFVSFLGGEDTLRGFGDRTLPRSGVGALSAASVGVESRFHKVVWRRADLFGFIDAGMLGGRNLGLVAPYLMSPGAGIRWESPIGVVRTYLAQRFALQEPAGSEHYGRDYRFGFTFGQEF